MSDRPIIFSAPMVRALLDGRKTMTRRIAKPVPLLDHFASEQLEDFELRGFEAVEQPDGRHLVYRPLWQAGDRLWVKEAFARVGDNEDDIHACPDLRVRAYYRADAPCPEQGRWRSPSFMPRALSRLTLIVTEVRVERLQDISEEDAVAEGATMRPACHGFRQQYGGWSMDWSQVGQPSKFALTGCLSEAEVSLGGAREAFGAFINELHDQRWNLKGDGIWGENPWVAAITFQTVRQNIDSLDRPVTQSSGGEA